MVRRRVRPSFCYTYVDVRGKKQLRCVDRATGRFISKREVARREKISKARKRVWRLTVAINYVQHHHYFSYYIQVWGTKKELEAIERDEKDNCVRGVVKILGYEEGVGWDAAKGPHVAYDVAKKRFGRIEENEEISKKEWLFRGDQKETFNWLE